MATKSVEQNRKGSALWVQLDQFSYQHWVMFDHGNLDTTQKRL